MLKKSEVNDLIARGVSTAHVFKLMKITYGPSKDHEILSIMREAMAESILAIDLGYSCSQEDLEAELIKISSIKDTPNEVHRALEARKLLKQIEPLQPAEQKAKLKELMQEKLSKAKAQ